MTGNDENRPNRRPSRSTAGPPPPKPAPSASSSSLSSSSSALPRQQRYLPVKSSGYGRSSAPPPKSSAAGPPSRATASASTTSRSASRPKTASASARTVNANTRTGACNKPPGGAAGGGARPSTTSSTCRPRPTSTRPATSTTSSSTTGSSTAAKRKGAPSTAAAFARPTHSSIRSLRLSGYESDDVSVGSVGSARSVVSARSVASARSSANAAAAGDRGSRSSSRRRSEMPSPSVAAKLAAGGSAGTERGAMAAASPSSSSSRRRMSEIPSPSMTSRRATGATASSTIKTRGMSPSPSRRMSEIPSPLGSATARRYGMSPSPSRVLSGSRGRGAAGAAAAATSPSPLVRSGVVGSAEIERMARASSRPRDRNSDDGSSWAQQQREKMMQRKQEACKQVGDGRGGEAGDGGGLTLSATTRRGTNDGLLNLSKYDDINRSLKRSAPSPSAAGTLESIEEDGCGDRSSKRVKTGSTMDNGPANLSSAYDAAAAKKEASSAKTPSKRFPNSSPASSRRKSKITTPSSYRKTVALSGGAATPTIVRELFDNKSKSSILSELSSFDPNALSSRSVAEAIFAPGTGIADGEIRKALTAKTSTANKWELKKQLEASTVAIRRLKDTMNQLQKGKNKFLAGAIEAERTARSGWARALHKVKELDDDRTALKRFAKTVESEAVMLRDETKEARRDLDQSAERVRSLEGELGPLREKLEAAEKAHNEVCIALAVAEARADEASKQAEGWRNQIACVETSKAELLKRSETAAALTADKEASALRMKVGELKASLALQTSELEKAISDRRTAEERVATKDKDMSDLTKGLRDVQQSGNAREEEANALRKQAEEKTAEIERQYTEARHQISILTTEKEKLTEALESTKTDLTTAVGSIQSLKDKIAEMNTSMTSQNSQVEIEKELRARAEQNSEEERRERIATSAQMVAMASEHSKAEAQWLEVSQEEKRQLRQQIESQAKTLLEKEEEMRNAKETISALEGERNALKKNLKEEKNIADSRNVEEVSRLTGEVNVLQKRLKDEEERAQEAGVVTRGQVLELEEQLRELQAERKRMHTLIQELRGNVRVCARVRPFLPDDGVDDEAKSCIVTRTDSEMRLVKRDGGSSQEYKFSFDRVFGPSSGQDCVFEEVSEFVQSALDGFNVCLFSYGQTGSGKTHTMQGSGSGAMRGIIPRSLDKIGQYKKSLEKDGWRYEASCSYLEIYQEKIRDLLRSEKAGETKHDIKVDGHGNRIVTNLTIQPLDPSDQDAINDVMRVAVKHRSVGATDMNALSSRSHAVFTLYLQASNDNQGRQIRSQLNLVDLAGSERLDRSGAMGSRAKEAMSINKSLSSLADVFVALQAKSSHVPYRNSKLTYLLQPCLSGEGKTLMVVNLSPTETSAQESLSSLRFASQVNQVELGRAKRKIEDTNTSREAGGTPAQKKKSGTSMLKWSSSKKR